jgi:hypothetical protein
VNVSTPVIKDPDRLTLSTRDIPIDLEVGLDVLLLLLVELLVNDLVDGQNRFAKSVNPVWIIG